MNYFIQNGMTYDIRTVVTAMYTLYTRLSVKIASLYIFLVQGKQMTEGFLLHLNIVELVGNSADI